MMLRVLILFPMIISVYAFVGCTVETKWSSTCLLNMATSSRDLKTAKSETTTTPTTRPSKVASRLAKAAREAVRQAEESNKQEDIPDTSDDDDENLQSITILSQAIDAELLNPGDGYRSARESNSLRTLLDHNEIIEETKNPKKIKELYDAAIVFSKPLWKDQITKEYASRLISLARAIKDENYQPALICFCGSKKTKNGSLVAATSAGIVFFRHLCAANQISLEETDFCVAQHEDSERSWSSSTLRPVVEEFKERRYLENWLEASNTYESATDEYGMTRQEPRKKVHIHWTLISTEYHLCNLNDIHLRSPRQSPLNTLQQGFDHTVKESRGIVRTTWCFRYSTYPYIHAHNDLTAFLGKCYLLSQGLRPLLVNLRGVVKQVRYDLRMDLSIYVKHSSNIDLPPYYI
jgi:hypothetical protein